MWRILLPWSPDSSYSSCEDQNPLHHSKGSEVSLFFLEWFDDAYMDELLQQKVWINAITKGVYS
jgi:hypothetical protein